MPSVDEALMRELYTSGKTVLFAEQNNGYLWSEFRKRMFALQPGEGSRFLAINSSDESDRPQYIHSAMYGELIAQFNLHPEGIATEIAAALK
jgi:hypothetical protein